MLSRGYRLPSVEIARAIWGLAAADNVVTDGPALEAGLEFLEAGGDFADGVIFHEGRSLGGDTFVSFDRKAVGLIEARGGGARYPRSSRET